MAWDSGIKTKQKQIKILFTSDVNVKYIKINK